MELFSDIKLHKQEIRFLLRIITRQYTNYISREKVKLLDNYWKEFEKLCEKFKLLEEKLTTTTKNDADVSDLYNKYLHVTNSLKIMKTNLYNYLESNQEINS